MYSQSDNIEIIIGNDSNETIQEFFNSFLQKYSEVVVILFLIAITLQVP